MSIKTNIYSCGWALALVLPIFSAMFLPTNSSHEFKNSLFEDQKKKQKEIVNQRLRIFIMGLLLGLGVSIYLKIKKNIGNCHMVILTVLVCKTYYLLYDGKDSMVNYLKNLDQMKLYKKVSTSMGKKEGISNLIMVGYIIYSIVR